MQFLIIGKDGKDKDAPLRRTKVRDTHLSLGNELLKSGNRWYGAVLTDDNGNMIGSMAIMDFPSKKELDEYLKREPYVLGNVWKTIEITKCNVKRPWKFNRPKAFFSSKDVNNT